MAVRSSEVERIWDMNQERVGHAPNINGVGWKLRGFGRRRCREKRFNRNELEMTTPPCIKTRRNNLCGCSLCRRGRRCERTQPSLLALAAHIEHKLLVHIEEQVCRRREGSSQMAAQGCGDCSMTSAMACVQARGRGRLLRRPHAASFAGAAAVAASRGSAET
eukprot:762829-Hanusia_phi.AAC.1